MPRMAALSGRHNGLVEVLIRRAKKRLKRQRRCMYLSDGVAVKKQLIAPLELVGLHAKETNRSYEMNL